MEDKYNRIQEEFTVIDLCRYESLRSPTFFFSFLILSFDFMYYAHSIVIDRIGFNPTLNQALINSSEIFGILLSLLFV